MVMKVVLDDVRPQRPAQSNANLTDDMWSFIENWWNPDPQLRQLFPLNSVDENCTLHRHSPIGSMSEEDNQLRPYSPRSSADAEQKGDDGA
jgi:hypothetical protein